jgi:uncharacterized membrane protein YbhN (UPF0104 family)
VRRGWLPRLRRHRLREPRDPGASPRIGRRLATLGLLLALAVALLFSVPGLRPVRHQIGRINPVWLAVAVALELASDVSFVVLFRLFFDRLAGRDARLLAWTDQSSSALFPAGGVGGLAIGGWLIHLMGAPVGGSSAAPEGCFGRPRPTPRPSSVRGQR